MNIFSASILCVSYACLFDQIFSCCYTIKSELNVKLKIRFNHVILTGLFSDRIFNQHNSPMFDEQVLIFVRSNQVLDSLLAWQRKPTSMLWIYSRLEVLSSIEMIHSKTSFSFFLSLSLSFFSDWFFRIFLFRQSDMSLASNVHRLNRALVILHVWFLDDLKILSCTSWLHDENRIEQMISEMM